MIWTFTLKHMNLGFVYMDYGQGLRISGLANWTLKGNGRGGGPEDLNLRTRTWD